MTASPLHPCDCDTPHSSGGTVPEIRIRNNEIFGKCLINSLASVYPDLESNMSDYQKVPSVARGGIRADRGTELHPSHRRLAWHNHEAADGARVTRWWPLALTAGGLWSGLPDTLVCTAPACSSRLNGKCGHDRPGIEQYLRHGLEIQQLSNVERSACAP